jgi:molybdenum cofactor guanylyltransferase
MSSQGLIAGIILAGGRSSRMGRDKALTPLAGRPMIAHVLERLRPQIDFAIISANGDSARFDGLGAPVIGDKDPNAFAGPLAGISAALAFARNRQATLLASAPCDAPFLPVNLVARLREALEAANASAAVPRYAGEIEPMFGLWRVSMHEEIESTLTRGEDSPRALLKRCGAAVVDFAGQSAGNPFENINDFAALAAAEVRLASRC